MKTFKIVCLAKSRKNGAYCIAGKDLDSNSWIRPISANDDGELSSFDICYDENENEPKLLDVFSFDVKKHCPQLHQQENYLIDTKNYWDYLSRFSKKNMDSLADTPKTLWPNSSSSGSGKNDRVTESEIVKIKNSLYLVKAQDVTIVVTQFMSTPKKVRAEFLYNGVKYNLRVTDDIIEKQYMKKNADRYSFDECFLTVSLGVVSPYDNFYYKLVAGLIIP